MSTTKYIALDLETGGLSSKLNPILTLYMAAVTEDLVIVDEIDLKLIPESPWDKVEAEALAVNGINLQEHIANPQSLTYEQARVVVSEFLKKHGGNSKKTRPKPLGQNIDFDLNFIKHQFFTEAEWDKMVHYGKMDTKVVCDFLKDCEWLPAELGSLTSMVQYFNIPMLKAHTAKDDVRMCIEVYGKLRQLLESRKNNNSISSNIIDILES